MHYPESPKVTIHKPKGAFAQPTQTVTHLLELIVDIPPSIKHLALAPKLEPIGTSSRLDSNSGL